MTIYKNFGRDVKSYIVVNNEKIPIYNFKMEWKTDLFGSCLKQVSLELDRVLEFEWFDLFLIFEYRDIEETYPYGRYRVDKYNLDYETNKTKITVAYDSMILLQERTNLIIDRKSVV